MDLYTRSVVACPGSVISSTPQDGPGHYFWFTMIFCTAERCALCLLVAGSSNCLRKQARKYLALSKQVFSRGVHDTLRELSSQLMDEAGAIDEKTANPPSRRI